MCVHTRVRGAEAGSRRRALPVPVGPRLPSAAPALPAGLLAVLGARPGALIPASAELLFV